MATFITTLHFTEKGVTAVRDTCERAAAFKATAKNLSVTVKGGRKKAAQKANSNR